MPGIAPLQPPYAPELEAALRKWMPPGASADPLTLFRILARHSLLFERLRPLGAALLGKGGLPVRDCETLILRSCARCGAEYKWGVHISAFARPLGFSDDEIAATRRGGEELLLRAADELHDQGTLSDAVLAELRARYSDEQILRSSRWRVSTTCSRSSPTERAARVPLEPWAERFPPGTRS